MKWIINLYHRYWTSRFTWPNDDFEFVTLCRNYADLRVRKSDFEPVQHHIFRDLRKGLGKVTLIDLVDQLPSYYGAAAYEAAVNRLKRARRLPRNYNRMSTFALRGLAARVPNRRPDNTYLSYSSVEDFLELCEFYLDLELTGVDAELAPADIWENWLRRLQDTIRVENPTIGDYLQYVTPSDTSPEALQFSFNMRAVIIGRLKRAGVLKPFFTDSLNATDFLNRSHSPVD